MNLATRHTHRGKSQAWNVKCVGTHAKLAVAYYYYPDANCAATTCDLNVGFISSDDNGTTWTPSRQVVGSMSLDWLSNTTGGAMVGNYIYTSFINGTPYPFFAVATAPIAAGGFNEAIFTQPQTSMP